MSRLELAEDILLLILQFCDVGTVLSTTQVNKHFRGIALAKHLWIHLIEDLVARRLVDLPHDRSLQDYTTAELIEEVKKLVIGPRTWSRRSRSPPTILRHIKISPSHNILSNSLRNLELLPGGKYLAAIHDTRIELWHVATCALIWCLQAGLKLYTIELLEYVDTVLFAFEASESRGTVKVLSIDPSSGESTEVFAIDLPDGTLLAERPMLCDGFLLCELRGNLYIRGSLYLLVHWHENQAVILRDFAQPYVWANSMKLLPGHIVFADSDAPHNIRIYVCALVSLSGMWQPATSARLLEASIDLGDVPAVATQELPFINFHRAMMRLYKSPLRHDVYKLIVYHIVDVEHPAPRRHSLKWIRDALIKRNSPPRGPEHTATLWTFHVAISKNILIDWVASSAPVFAVPYCSPLQSYAGYIFDLSSDCSLVNLHLRCEDGRCSPQHNTTAVKGPHRRSYLSPYSHAITVRAFRRNLLVGQPLPVVSHSAVYELSTTSFVRARTHIPLLLLLRDLGTVGELHKLCKAIEVEALVALFRCTSAGCGQGSLCQSFCNIELASRPRNLHNQAHEDAASNLPLATTVNVHSMTRSTRIEQDGANEVHAKVCSTGSTFSSSNAYPGLLTLSTLLP
ncbi:hypothetical protein C8J57DRAFT_1727071 [Mycena rebaudengoi]|nr:hypothetical protein C8J57DRAFT_1727071 [Mycena rebaudengoi]